MHKGILITTITDLAKRLWWNYPLRNKPHTAMIKGVTPLFKDKGCNWKLRDSLSADRCGPVIGNGSSSLLAKVELMRDQEIGF